MATHPFSILVDGVNSGANILDDYSTASPTTPWVDPSTVRLTQDASGEGASLSFDVIQVKTPVAGPWWKSGNVYDNARVRFQVSGTTTFLGYITQIEAQLAENGVGTRATVTAAPAVSFLDKIIVNKGRKADPAGTYSLENTWAFSLGTSSSTDQSIMTSLVSTADAAMGRVSASGRTANRLIIATNTTPDYGSSATATIGKQKFTKPGTLRSFMDTIKEAAQSEDGLQRRYWVKPNGQIAYQTVSAPPTYADAPFKIITTPSFNTTAQPSTIVPRDLRVSLDHDSIVKKVNFVMSEGWSKVDSKISGGVYTVTDPYSRVYDAAAPNGAGMTTRNGPRPEKIIEVNPSPAKANAPNYWSDKITNYSKRYFGTNTYPNNAAPVRSISFSIRGASASGTNQYGYSEGYKQTGPSSYLLTNWEAGQYVSIVSADLDLNGLYRIEQLSMSFETGSMIRKFDFTCERVPMDALKRWLRKAVG